MIELILIPYIFYFICVLYFSFNYSKKTLQNASTFKDFSIIVPFRNEDKNLQTLLKSIKSIKYKGRFELLLIDDHSEDNSLEIVEECLRRGSINYKILGLKKCFGKKNAIIKGVDSSSYNHIALTDADCILPSNWLDSLNNTYSDSKVDFIVGPISFVQSGILSYLQNVELSAILALTEWSTLIKRPILCNGANLSYKKEVFNSKYLLGEKSLSGEDVFLLYATKKDDNRNIVFNSNSIVKTKSTDNLKDFLSQRLRWASKSIYIKDRDTLLFGFYTTLLNTIILLLLVLSLFNHKWLLVFILSFLIKFLSDLIMVDFGKRYTKVKNHFLGSILISIVYPFYSLLIATFSLFLKPRWKDRKV